MEKIFQKAKEAYPLIPDTSFLCIGFYSETWIESGKSQSSLVVEIEDYRFRYSLHEREKSHTHLFTFILFKYAQNGIGSKYEL